MSFPLSEAELLFWVAVLVLAYTYAGYPVLIRLRAALSPRRWRTGDDCPTVTIVVVAHNEAARIRRRIENLLAADYPTGRFDVIVASDGSTDETASRARRFAGRRLTVLAFDRRRGKPAVLNDVVPRAWGDIVVFADARQDFEPGALRALVAPFADPSVGVVSGELMLSPAGGPSGAAGVGFYWRYEKAIRRAESLVDSTVGATGAIYAIRRRLFEPIPADTLLDDVVIPMRAARRGYRIVWAGAARAWDRVASPRQEFARKVRTIAGNFQLLSRERWLLAPQRNRLWFQTLSHKGLRLVAPLCLALALGANLQIADAPVYRATLGAQALFYATAALGFTAERARWSARWLSAPYVFCLLNWATVVGFVRFATGRQAVTWQRPVAPEGTLVTAGPVGSLGALGAPHDPAAPSEAA